VKAKKTNNEKKPHAAQSFLPCRDFQKMAEVMKTFCTGEGEGGDCCSIMRRMMGKGKGAGAEETKETQKAPKCGENG
jgi:hypothetical protein